MRLFIKLFLSFWLLAVLMAVLVAWGGYYLRGEVEAQVHQQVEQLLARRGVLVSLLETEGAEAMVEALIRDPQRDALFVVDGQGKELLGRPLPPVMSRYAGRTRHHRHGGGRMVGRERGGPGPPPWAQKRAGPLMGGPPPWIHKGPPRWLLRLMKPLSVQDHQGMRFVFMLEPPRPRLMALVMERYPWSLPLVLVVSALLVLLLAQHFTRPIQRLRQVSLRLANGDLSARAAPFRRRLPDELSDLGGDFNFMAEKLEGLFYAQQRLLRDVSHELRSPMARMRAALGLMERGMGENEGGNRQRLELELERLDRLIGQIITVSRPQSVGNVHRESWIDLKGLVHAVVDDAAFEAQQGRKRLELVLDEEGGDMLIRADASGLQAAVENIIRNALRHTPDQSCVKVRLKWGLEEQGMQAILTVSDQGSGVPEPLLPNIFKPFFRVDEARDRSQGGFGLGLAIAARAIRDHEGEIEAANGESGGLIISVRLPLEQAPGVMHDEETA
ncbi:MAG: HAMP domain-containing protein [Magnetococcales bacterium]|nr:HAMP domain-containing protein [Magnetococcales bacterium]